MQIDEILTKIEKDSVLDINHLDEESLSIPILHSRYYQIYIDEYRVLKGLELTFKKLLRFKFEYYQGKSPDHVYQEKPFSLRVSRQDLDIYIDSDEEIQELRKKIEIQKIKCDRLQEMIKLLNNRSFIIRDAIEFLKWKGGK